MPRKASGLNESGRIRQQRYRQRLALKAVPEVAVIDTAAAVAVAEMLTILSFREGKVSIKDLINRGLTAGVTTLKAKGHDGPACVRLLNRRISSLRLGLAGRSKA